MNIHKGKFIMALGLAALANPIPSGYASDAPFTITSQVAGHSPNIVIRSQYDFEKKISLKVTPDPRLLPSDVLIKTISNMGMRDANGVRITSGFDVDRANNLVLAFSGGTSEIIKAARSESGVTITASFKDARGNFVAPPSGSLARWADRNHLLRRHYGEHGKIFLGYSFPEHNKARSYAITSNTQRHLLTVAPTRSGKLLTSSMPRCLEHQGSLVALDVKDGELSLIAARYRRDVLGHKVVIIDPWDEACSHLGMTPARINALDWLDPENDDFVEDAILIADSIVADRGDKDPFWNDEARALIMGLILYVAATPHILIPTEKKSRDLAQVRRLLNLSAFEFKAMVGGKFEKDENGNKELIHPGMAQSRNEHVRAAASRILNKADKELSGVISNAQQNTHFLESPKIQRSLEASDFSFEELEHGKLDIFIVLPAGRLYTYSRYLRMLISIAITTVTRFKKKPSPPVYFLIEEAAALGRLATIETAYGLMAGYGMQLHMIVQDLNQLSSIYEKRWQTFVANSGVIQAFGTNDLMTAEYISKLCGVTTIESLSERSAEERAGLFSDPGYLSREDSLISRRLITPDEVTTMHPAAQILILSHAHPVACFKTAYFLDQRYRKQNGQPIFDMHPHYADRKLAPPVDFNRKGIDIGSVLERIFEGG